jgi:hypothetical protein
LVVGVIAAVIVKRRDAAQEEVHMIGAAEIAILSFNA